MRKIGLVEILSILLAIIIALIIFTLVISLYYPDAAKSILKDIRQEVKVRKSPALSVAIKISRRLADGYNYRAKPWAEKVKNFSLAIAKGRKKEAGKKQSLKIKANDCLRCHKTLFQQRGFANLYIDHRRHQANGVKCADCHRSIKHPRPESVSEKICLDCHQRRRVSKKCRVCHPPGSILNDAIIPSTDTAKFLAGSTVKSISLTVGDFAAPKHLWLRGQGDPVCRNCHPVPSFCNKCHKTFHKKIADWRLVHGRRLLKGEYSTTTCKQCHNPSWCAATCHSNNGNPGHRRKAFAPAPTVPLPK